MHFRGLRAVDHLENLGISPANPIMIGVENYE
jgi:hypothetical protein